MDYMAFEETVFEVIDGKVKIRIERPSTEYRAYFQIGSGDWSERGEDVVGRVNLVDFTKHSNKLTPQERLNAHHSSDTHLQHWKTVVSHVVKQMLLTKGFVDFVRFRNQVGSTVFRDAELKAAMEGQIELYFKGLAVQSE